LYDDPILAGTQALRDCAENAQKPYHHVMLDMTAKEWGTFRSPMSLDECFAVVTAESSRLSTGALRRELDPGRPRVNRATWGFWLHISSPSERRLMRVFGVFDPEGESTMVRLSAVRDRTIENGATIACTVAAFLLTNSVLDDRPFGFDWIFVFAVLAAIGVGAGQAIGLVNAQFAANHYSTPGLMEHYFDARPASEGEPPGPISEMARRSLAAAAAAFRQQTLAQYALLVLTVMYLIATEVFDLTITGAGVALLVITVLLCAWQGVRALRKPSRRSSAGS
jgi:hypothetical protein